LIDALVRSRAIEIRSVLAEDAAEVRFAHDHYMIEAFTPDTPQQAFVDRVGLWCSDRCPEHLNPGSYGNGRELWAVFCIVVPNQIPWRFPKRCRFPQLLGDPCI
jgi:hypothetical protein